MIAFNNLYIRIKENLKNHLHDCRLIPYRKKSKRYRVWDHETEKHFLYKIGKHYEIQKNQIDKIKATVIMPTYNRAFCLPEAIKSVLDQSHKNLQLIIIDDGSTDDTKTVVDDFVDKRIEYLRIKQSGISGARNTGIENARGEYIFYLDSDNRWVSDYIRNMLVFMKTGKLDAAYAGIRIHDDQGKVLGYFGESFDWRECLELNYVDINGFAHAYAILRKGYQFDNSLKRLVDWDFILGITLNESTAYAPFIGVDYYDGIRGNRVTFTEYSGRELDAAINYIQEKHQDISKHHQHMVGKNPVWQSIIND